MKEKLGAAFLAGVFLVSTVLPATVLAGTGKMKAKSKTIQTRTWRMAMTQDQLKDQIRLHDGSCQDAEATESTILEEGNTYGPGDGTGYLVNDPFLPPADGTGYGPGTR